MLAPVSGVGAVIIRVVFASIAALALAGCSTADPKLGLDGHRTVFHNPYAPIELENGPVGPDQCRGCPEGVWIDGLFYPGRGWFAYDRFGARIPLSRQERRQARDRFRQITALIEQNRAVEQFNARKDSVPLPVPSAPPVASSPAPATHDRADRGQLPAPAPAPTSSQPMERHPF
jgi:hypothetical protein